MRLQFYGVTVSLGVVLAVPLALMRVGVLPAIRR